LLSGLAAIDSAYPPEFSIRLEGIEASHEREKTLIFLQKTRAASDYNEGRKRTQGQNPQKGRKITIFIEACAKRADFTRENALWRHREGRCGYAILLNLKVIKEKQ
jgi:hypothetical protein